MAAHHQIRGAGISLLNWSAQLKRFLQRVRQSRFHKNAAPTMAFEPRLQTPRLTQVALLVSVLLTGCQTIPDMSTWDQSTKDLSVAVVVGFKTAAEINADMAKRLDPLLSEKPEYKDPATRYGSAAKALSISADSYEKLFGAVADYSSSLAAIARASSSGQQTVDAVAGSLNQFVGAIGATPLAGAGFELGKLLAEEIIKVKAARDFSDAVGKADPVIDRISKLLESDLASLQKTVGATKDEAILAAMRDPHKARLEYRESLIRRQRDLQQSVSKAVAPPRKNPTDPPPPTTSLLNAGDAPELAKIDQFLREADLWYLPLQDQIDRALKTRAKAEELVIETSRGISAWRSSHASLAAAAAERRMPESARLAALAVRIRELVTEMKKEK